MNIPNEILDNKSKSSDCLLFSFSIDNNLSKRGEKNKTTTTEYINSYQ